MVQFWTFEQRGLCPRDFLPQGSLLPGPPGRRFGSHSAAQHPFAFLSQVMLPPCPRRSGAGACNGCSRRTGRGGLTPRGRVTLAGRRGSFPASSELDSPDGANGDVPVAGTPRRVRELRDGRRGDLAGPPGRPRFERFRFGDLVADLGAVTRQRFRRQPQGVAVGDLQVGGPDDGPARQVGLRVRFELAVDADHLGSVPAREVVEVHVATRTTAVRPLEVNRRRSVSFARPANTSSRSRADAV